MFIINRSFSLIYEELNKIATFSLYSRTLRTIVLTCCGVGGTQSQRTTRDSTEPTLFVPDRPSGVPMDHQRRLT